MAGLPIIGAGPWRRVLGAGLVAAVLSGGAPGLARAAYADLPPASDRPLEIDFSRDPVLLLRQLAADPEAFRALLRQTVERHPSSAEAAALEDEAAAALDQVEAERLPSIDLSLTSYRVLSREFSNDPSNLLERTRPAQRTDATVQVQQTVFDFGAGARRARAASARLGAAAVDVEATSDRVVLNAVGAWYDVFGYRALAQLAEAYVANLSDMRAAVQERIRQGVLAEADLARADNLIAQGQTRLARYRRLQASAEARFTAVVGAPPMDGLARAPALPSSIIDADGAMNAARASAPVRSAELASLAAREEAGAARADRMPQVAAGIDAGRYGVFETERDYDVRARVVLRQRLFGGGDARVSQAEARSRAADARVARIREEAARDAAIAWSDVEALEEQLRAMEDAYIANRRSRDAIVARFREARGSVFDVNAAEESYFDSATAYIQALTELDAARYVLLSRTGQLLPQLGIDPASEGGQL